LIFVEPRVFTQTYPFCNLFETAILPVCAQAQIARSFSAQYHSNTTPQSIIWSEKSLPEEPQLRREAAPQRGILKHRVELQRMIDA
jgi:hypothetical protein